MAVAASFGASLRALVVHRCVMVTVAVVVEGRVVALPGMRNKRMGPTMTSVVVVVVGVVVAVVAPETAGRACGRTLTATLTGWTAAAEGRSASPAAESEMCGFVNVLCIGFRS